MTADWSVLDEDVQSVCDKAASKAHRQYSEVADLDDMKQEAYIIVATHAETTRGYVEREELGLLHRFVWEKVVHIFETDAKRKSRHYSYEQVREEADPDFV